LIPLAAIRVGASAAGGKNENKFGAFYCYIIIKTPFFSGFEGFLYAYSDSGLRFGLGHTF
jgi:hypothetical protein